VEGHTNGRKKRRKRIIYGSVAAVLVLVIAGALIAATSGGIKIEASKLAKVERGDLAKSVVATGKITPITEVEIKSKASGIVKKLYVDYGDKVKKGQLLAELDRDEIQARVVFDMVYDPVETHLLQVARSKGISVIPGVEMFVQQAARQFEIWTGKPAPAGDMLRAVTITLQERAATQKQQKS